MAKGDEKLIGELAGGKSYEAVAQLCGCDRATVYRRMKNPAFRRRVRAARRDVLERTLGHVAQAAVSAVVALRNLLKSPSEKVRLGAAVAVLNAQSRLYESEELAADVEDLKAQVAKLTRLDGRRRKEGL